MGAQGGSKAWVLGLGALKATEVAGGQIPDTFMFSSRGCICKDKEGVPSQYFTVYCKC